MSKIIILVLICMTIVVNADKEYDEIVAKSCDKNIKPETIAALDKCCTSLTPKPLTDIVQNCLKEMGKEGNRETFVKVICDPTDGPKLKTCRSAEIKKMKDNGTFKDIKSQWESSKECMKKALGM